MRFMATVVVAISSSHGPGAAMQMGLVPRRACRPCQGGTMVEALQNTSPICPASAIFCAQYAAAPKWLDSRTLTTATPCSRAMRMAWPQQISEMCCPMPFSPS